MPYEQIVAIMRRHYNSETRKLQLQSEMDSLDLASFMRKKQISDSSQGLMMIVNHINALAPQLPDCFGNESHKTRYLRKAVMSFDWAQQPIASIASSRYSFLQLISALQESLQLREEAGRAQALEKNYGQYVNHPRTVRHPSNYYLNPQNRYKRDRRNSPFNRWNRARSLSDDRRSSGTQGHHHRNPNFRRQRFCYGCGSPDHILRDRKCTPQLSTIKTNLIEELGCEEETISDFADELLTLHITQRTQSSSLERSPKSSLKRIDGEREATNNVAGPAPASVYFDETLYTVEEEDMYSAQLKPGFNSDAYNVLFTTDEIPSTNIVDCSNIHLTATKSSPEVPGFCIDIGAPRSVCGKRTMNKLLGSLKRTTIPSAKSYRYFRFGDVVVKSLGLAEVALCTPHDVPNVMVLMDVVPVDVPGLLGLDVLDCESL